jgi:hypothetical protein
MGIGDWGLGIGEIVAKIFFINKHFKNPLYYNLYNYLN